LRKIPKLLTCNPESFCGAIMACSQLGLEPGNSMGQIYLIPFGKEVQVILGYKGMIELARRSGQIVSLSAHEVFKNDIFEFEYGLEEKLKHVPDLLGEDRGDLVAVYAVAKFVGGGHQIEVMSKSDVDKIRKRSKSGNVGPWATDYNEMAKKTVLRKLFKYLPISIEKINMVNELEEGADLGNQNMKAVFQEANGEEYEIDYETGEIIEESIEEPKEQSDSLADKLK
jgi:recombination protein RecT